MPVRAADPGPYELDEAGEHHSANHRSRLHIRQQQRTGQEARTKEEPPPQDNASGAAENAFQTIELRLRPTILSGFDHVTDKNVGPIELVRTRGAGSPLRGFVGWAAHHGVLSR